MRKISLHLLGCWLSTYLISLILGSCFTWQSPTPLPPAESPPTEWLKIEISGYGIYRVVPGSTMKSLYTQLGLKGRAPRKIFFADEKIEIAKKSRKRSS